MTTILFVALGSFVVSMLLFVLVLGRQSRQSVMLEQIARQARADFGEVPGVTDWSAYRDWIARPSAFIRGIVSKKPDPEVARRLSLAGYRQPEHADIFIGSRLAVPALLGLLVVIFVSTNVLFFVFMAMLIGFFIPDFWLAEATKRRRERIGDSLPDTLDLISICMDAGLGLDQAIVRVGHEVRWSQPDITTELLQINFEQSAGVPRIDSWRAFSERVPLDSLRNLVSMLIQTERFGTPIAQALSTFSETLRRERTQAAEEVGARAAVKLVFPMVIFIFPMMFVVTVGPAVLGLINNFSKLLE